MPARLQLKLGAVTDQDRLPDSPDTIVVVEPSVGSVGRTKGNLYLLVTSTVPGNRAREATRMVADTIRNEYYYDESAGIRQCLTKVLGVANKRLAHQRDKYGLAQAADGAGPIGVAVAVVRGRELYVATVGPAEAYLIRQARLSTLPDPNRERGLPAEGLEPEVWRGELQVGDSLSLVSANVMGRIGSDALKDALVTLHPQSAIEHLHARFVAADGKGSDGAFAFEASEVGATYKARSLVPVRPAEPLAGAPDKGPIPLADSAVGAAAAVGVGAARARDAAGSGFGRFVWRIQDLLPRRKPGSRKVTAATSRMETQRRAAVALLAFIAVAGGLVLGVYAVAGQQSPTEPLRSLSVAQRAFQEAEEAAASVSGPGVDLIADDPSKALELLTAAYDKLDEAQAAGYPAAEVSGAARRGQRGPRPPLRRRPGPLEHRLHLPGRHARAARGAGPRERRRPLRARQRRQDRLAHRPRQEDRLAGRRVGAEGIGRQGRGPQGHHDGRPRRRVPGHARTTSGAGARCPTRARGRSRRSTSRTRPRGATTSR